MRLTHESKGMRWTGLLVALAAITALLWLHSDLVKQYIAVLDSTGLRGAPEPSTPLKRVCPTMYADAQMWARHSLALADGAGPRLRFTQVDNAPIGREVHWNSLFAWTLAAFAKARQGLYGETMPDAVEKSMAWFNLPLLLAFVAGFAVWVTRRSGLGAGIFIAFAMVANPYFYSVFEPNYVDHHGVLAACIMGLALGAIFMGFGFRRTSESEGVMLPYARRDARAAAIASAVFGAVGMWFSAATFIPAIVIVGGAGAVAILIFGAPRKDISRALEPEVWRLWGAIGGGACLAFYVLEYAPFNLGLRLEVNHPLYAAGWWAGAEIIAQLAEWRMGTLKTRSSAKKTRLWLALGAVALAPLVIKLGGERVFVVFDPFIARLSQHVAEGLSYFKALQVFGSARLVFDLPWLALSLLALVAIVWRSSRIDRPLALVMVLCTFGFGVMSLAQMRWCTSGSAFVNCLLLVGLIAFASPLRPWLRWLCVAVFVVGIFVPFGVVRIQQKYEAVTHLTVDKNDAMQPIYRDIAAALRASQPVGELVVLASPNASCSIGYYGQLKTIGTLYWENLEGTKAAAEMFSAESEAEARRLLRERGVTHVAVVSEENFLVQYYDLLRPGGTQEQFAKTFGYALLVKREVPIWLEQIPYELPSDVPFRPEAILLYKTRFGSSNAAETLYEEAVRQINLGQLTLGSATLDRAIAADPTSAEYRVIKAHLQLFQKDPAAAFQTVQQALPLLKDSRRFVVAVAEGNGFYAAGAHQYAVALYRSALRDRFDLTVANNLGWLLATSRDDSLRNGKEALALAQRAVAAQKNYTTLTALAAALAEVGQFEQAAQVAETALDLARPSNDSLLISRSEARLQAFRTRQAWRE